MIQNEGELDRTIRVVLGTGLFWLTYSSLEGLAKWILSLLTLTLVISGFTGYSGIYKRFGVTTNTKRLKV